jgi:hypothetical protein
LPGVIEISSFDLAETNGSKVQRVADDVWFRLAARGAMLILGFIGLPLFIYIGGGALNAITDLKDKQATMSAQLQVLQATISLQMTDRYRGDDARRDFQLRDIRIDANKDRIERLERKLENAEQRVGKNRP